MRVAFDVLTSDIVSYPPTPMVVAGAGF